MHVPSLWRVALMALAASLSAGQGAVLAVSEPAPVAIDYFFERGCADCYRVKRHVFPEIEERFSGLYALQEFDVGISANILTLIAYQQRLNIRDNEPVCMVLDRKYVLNGYGAIRKGLTEQINICLAERQEDGWTLPAAIGGEDGKGYSVRTRLLTFRWAGIAVAGFIDGINPCAISTLVFFMSMLTVSGIHGRRLLLVGMSFCLATFLTYTAIGFGLLRMLHGLGSFPVIRSVVDGAMLFILLFLAGWSFLDAYRYANSHQPDAMRLQLPKGLKLRIHEVIRNRLRAGNLIAGSFGIGVVVTALESVCTGQVYVPTLVLAVRSQQSAGRALAGLLLYNVAFLLPLAGVFVCCYAGVRSQSLVRWSGRHAITAKVIMGVFFLALALILFWL